MDHVAKLISELNQNCDSVQSIELRVPTHIQPYKYVGLHTYINMAHSCPMPKSLERNSSSFSAAFSKIRSSIIVVSTRC